MSSRVRPASATAARQASMVNDNGFTIRRRPRRERPTPDSTDRCSNRSSPSGARVAKWGGSPTRSASVVVPVGSKTGSHTSSWCSKRTATSWPIRTSSGSTPTMWVVRRTVGSSARATTAITYGGGNAGMPLVGVHGEAHDRGPPRHGLGLVGRAPTARAHGHRRVHEGAAVVAALDAQGAVLPRGPEPRAPGGQLGQRSHRCVLHARHRPRSAITWGRSTVVRMPGSASHT